MEVLGGWSKSTSSTIASIGRLLGQRIGQDTSATTRHFFQCLAVSLGRGNAAMWATRRQVLPPPIDGYVE